MQVYASKRSAIVDRNKTWDHVSKKRKHLCLLCQVMATHYDLN